MLHLSLSSLPPKGGIRGGLFLFLISLALGIRAQVSISDITAGKYSPQSISALTPMADGESYSQLIDKKRIVRTSFKTGKDVATLFDVATVRGKVSLSSIDGYILSPDESRILIQTNTRYVYRRTFTADYYIYDVANNRLEPLSDGGPQMSPLFSPDGNVVAFAREGNLFVVKLLYGNAETQVTKDGERGKIINGIPDWVNEEEFSTARSFCFSADSEMLIWVRYDESQVPVYDMPMYSSERLPYPYSYKYPVAGATNATVSVHSYDLKNRNTRQIDLPLAADDYIPRIATTSDADKVCIVTLNRHQDRMDIYMANPRSTVVKQVLREEIPHYVKEPAYTDLQFYPGHFAILSERSGHQHLYWYTLQGNLEQTVTKGDFEVTRFHGYDAATGRFFYTSTQESPLRRAVYATDRKGKTTKISQQIGTNSAIFSRNFRYFVNTYSNITQPPVTTLCDATGRTLHTLITNDALKQTADQQFGQKELLTLTTADGITLNAWMLRPRNFDPARKYPVIMYQYSGPGSQEVTDSWSCGFYPGGAFESVLAQEGYISVVVDGRGTGYRGAEWEKCTYLHLGQLEAHDQAAAAQALAQLPYIDGSRIGIWGWSFGGFNTLMSMAESKQSAGLPIKGEVPERAEGVFKAGCAVAPVTSWRFYDSAYTERFMRTPQENPDGYDDCPIARAANIKGALLLIHGTADDNVHFRNFTEMSEALVQADVPFDCQIYRNRNHSIYGGNTRKHLLTRILRHFKENL